MQVFVLPVSLPYKANSEIFHYMTNDMFCSTTEQGHCWVSIPLNSSIICKTCTHNGIIVLNDRKFFPHENRFSNSALCLVESKLKSNIEDEGKYTHGNSIRLRRACQILFFFFFLLDIYNFFDFVLFV